MPARIPQLKYHRPTNQHYVWYQKKRVHMGADRTAAEGRYKRWVAELVAGPPAGAPAKPSEPARPAAELTVAELLLAYHKYVSAERPDDAAQLNLVAHAITAVRENHAAVPVSQFRGPALKAVRKDLITNRKAISNGRATDRPISRRYVNYLIGAVQRCWQWALSEDLVPADAAATIAAVKRLRHGQGGRETRRVLPAAPGWDEALVELPPLLAAMVRVQALCGMRPQDVCRMRRREVSTAPAERVELPGTDRHLAAVLEGGRPVWVYCPGAHKTSWKGKPRAVAIGPQAQAVLRPLLAGLGPDDYVFSPAVALGQARRGNRFKREGYKRHYATRQYAQFVGRAIERANRPRAAAKWKPDELVPVWTPNQLRHLAATVVGDEIDREHARAMLGHSSADVVDVYMEQQFRKAARAAAECG